MYEELPRGHRSTVISTREYSYLFRLHLINEPMLLVDSSRAAPFQLVQAKGSR